MTSLEISDFRGCRVLRARAVGESLRESVMPAESRELPEELAKVDAILADDRFLAPFRSRLTATVGPPTIPIETYLGLGMWSVCLAASTSVC
jgi:transposase, IS5 family